MNKILSQNGFVNNGNDPESFYFRGFPYAMIHVNVNKITEKIYDLYIEYALVLKNWDTISLYLQHSPLNKQLKVAFTKQGAFITVEFADESEMDLFVKELKEIYYELLEVEP